MADWCMNYEYTLYECMTMIGHTASIRQKRVESIINHMCACVHIIYIYLYTYECLMIGDR